VKTVIYDIEIAKAIRGKNEAPIPGIEYCAGWQDHANMGISSIAAWDSSTDRFRVFLEDNLPGFATLIADADQIVTFNGISFDNAVCRAHSIEVPVDRDYDILVEFWQAAGLGPKFSYPSHIGFSLDAVCEANLGEKKSGNGALAPVLYQRDQIGELVDYNLNDVCLTKKIFDLIIRDNGVMKDPRDSRRFLTLTIPDV
jgi:hypothetical protein